eukprot:8237713-Ditylum_brightwellii.AAC.1
MQSVRDAWCEVTLRADTKNDSSGRGKTSMPSTERSQEGYTEAVISTTGDSSRNTRTNVSWSRGKTTLHKLTKHACAARKRMNMLLTSCTVQRTRKRGRCCQTCC